MIRMFTDTAVSGNPGYGGIGILIIKHDKQVQLSLPLQNNNWDNHSAEFKAVILGLEWLIENCQTDQMVFCHSDSQIVVQAIEKSYVKNPTFKKYLNQIENMMQKFTYIDIKWIPDRENKGADNLARQALQKAIKKNN